MALPVDSLRVRMFLLPTFALSVSTRKQKRINNIVINTKFKIYLNAVPCSFLCINNYRFHIFSKYFRYCNIVPFMGRLTHIDHTIILEVK